MTNCQSAVSSRGSPPFSPSKLRGNDGYLAAGVAGTVGEKAIVVAPGAGRAHCHFLDSCFGGGLSNQRAQVYVTWACHGLASELLPHIGTYLVAAPADCRA